jgi:hypothetical protein
MCPIDFTLRLTLKTNMENKEDKIMVVLAHIGYVLGIVFVVLMLAGLISWAVVSIQRDNNRGDLTVICSASLMQCFIVDNPDFGGANINFIWK